jgi:hypothetical protein
MILIVCLLYGKAMIAGKGNRDIHIGYFGTVTFPAGESGYPANARNWPTLLTPGIMSAMTQLLAI